MDKTPPFPMTPFDTVTTIRDLQIIKLLFPYIPPAVQRPLAFYIKFLEFQKTVEYFRSFSLSSQKEFTADPASLADTLETLKPYMGDNSETLDSILSAMSMMDMMQSMEMPGSGMDPGMFSGMMDMFQSAQNGNGASADDGNSNQDEKGTDEYGNGLDQSSGNEEY